MATFTQKTSKLIVKNTNGDLVQIVPETTAAQITYNSTDLDSYLANVPTFSDTVSTTANGLAPKVTDTTKYLKGDGTWDTPYTHPTTAGNKHIPSGGATNQILKWASDGTAQWSAEYSHPTTAGNKHIPSGGATGQHLTWASNGTAQWENQWVHPTTTSTTAGPTSAQTPAFGATFNVAKVTRDTYGHVSGLENITVTIPSATASTTANGLMSSTDKTTLNSLSTTITTLAPIASPTFTGTPKLTSSPTSTDDHAVADVNYVISKIDSKLAENDAMIYKGTITAASGLPATHNAGWTYKVAGTSNVTLATGKVAEPGDLIICNTDGTANDATYSQWDIVQGNIDGAVTGPASSTNLNIAVFDGTTGKVIKDGGKTIAQLTYTHPDTAGNKHIPSGGSSGQILKWSSNGTAQWDAEYSYTHPDTAGNKHIPSGGATNQYLVWESDGTAKWENKYVYTHPDTSGNKHIPSGGATNQILKWASDGTAQWAAEYSHPTTAGNKHIPSGGSSGQILKWSSNGTAQWAAEYSYNHPDDPGYKHIPSGGSSGQHLTWSSDGTAKWENMPAAFTHPTFTAVTGVPTANATLTWGATFSVNQVARDTYGHVSGITTRNVTIPGDTFGYAAAATAGTKGLVPAPAAGDQAKFLNAGSGWQALPMYVKVTSTEPTTANSTDVQNGSMIIYITN